VESKPRSSEHPFEQCALGRPAIATIVETVAEVFGDTPEDLRMRRGGTERSVVAWLGCYEGFARLGALAAALRLRSTSRVSAMIVECDLRLERDPLLRIAIDRCTDLLRHGTSSGSSGASASISVARSSRLIRRTPRRISSDDRRGERMSTRRLRR
jgi:hypothetical protein